MTECAILSTRLDILGTFLWVMAGTYQTKLSNLKSRQQERAEERFDKTDDDKSSIEDMEDFIGKIDKWLTRGLYVLYGLALCSIGLTLAGLNHVSDVASIVGIAC